MTPAGAARKLVKHKQGQQHRRNLAGNTNPDEVRAELERRRQAAAAGTPLSDAGDDQADDDGGSSSTPPASSSPLAGMSVPATGGGFVLGVMGWVLAMNFMQGGMPQVRKLLAAKFLNKTGG